MHPYSTLRRDGAVHLKRLGFSMAGNGEEAQQGKCLFQGRRRRTTAHYLSNRGGKASD
jgi:hypothetical protein